MEATEFFRTYLDAEWEAVVAHHTEPDTKKANEATARFDGVLRGPNVPPNLYRTSTSRVDRLQRYLASMRHRRLWAVVEHGDTFAVAYTGLFQQGADAALTTRLLAERRPTGWIVFAEQLSCDTCNATGSDCARCHGRHWLGASGANLPSALPAPTALHRFAEPSEAATSHRWRSLLEDHGAGWLEI